MGAKVELKSLQALLERNGKRIEDLTRWVTKDGKDSPEIWAAPFFVS